MDFSTAEQLPVALNNKGMLQSVSDLADDTVLKGSCHTVNSPFTPC